MQYAHLGRTGAVVSRLCLGTMNFGPVTPEKEAFAIMDEALALGINFFDTADLYGAGDKTSRGDTESIIGRWLAQGNGRREQIVLATKVFGPMGPGFNERGLSAYHIRQACEDSLRRLQTDHIDLYQMHHIDRGEPTPADRETWGLQKGELTHPPHLKRATPWEEIWQAMGQLVIQGKVVYVGSSNFAAWNIAQACERAAKRDFLGLVSEQSLYNLRDRTVELEVIPACQEYGLALIPWSPLAGGLLGGKLPKKQKGRRSWLQKSFEKYRTQLEAYEALCAEMGEKPADVALAWLLHNSVVTAPIIGPRTMEQLSGSLHSLEIGLSDEVIRRLNEIWPGPGGEAPEAYAW